MAHRLICPAACGVLPDQGLNPCPPPWQAILNHRTTREVLSVSLCLCLLLTPCPFHNPHLPRPVLLFCLFFFLPISVLLPLSPRALLPSGQPGPCSLVPSSLERLPRHLQVVIPLRLRQAVKIHQAGVQSLIVISNLEKPQSHSLAPLPRNNMPRL